MPLLFFELHESGSDPLSRNVLQSRVGMVMTRTGAAILSDDELEIVRQRALRALGEIRSAANDAPAEPNILFKAERTEAGRKLPSYYLVYFLLVDLLGFRNLGRFEKLAWSVPVEFNKKVYLIEHRKFGLGIFCVNPGAYEADAAEMVRCIWAACKAAEPYFAHRAHIALKAGLLNVHNLHRQLWGRLSYLKGRLVAFQAAKIKAENIPPKKRVFKNGGMAVSWAHHTRARERVSWLTQSVVEAFFAWSEHALVHFSVLGGSVQNGEALVALTKTEWRDKFQSAFDITLPIWKSHYDALVRVKDEYRNYVAHGAFGKDGQAFRFHSNAGAVPLMLTARSRGPQVTMRPYEVMPDTDSIASINAFLVDVRSHAEPMWIYLDSGLSSVLTFSADGTYAKATSSAKNMRNFVDYWIHEIDNAANMDW